MKLTFDLQRRDPKKGRAVVTRKTFDTARLGVVIVDMWNWHWCKTASERAAAMVPRIATLGAGGADLRLRLVGAGAGQARGARQGGFH